MKTSRDDVVIDIDKDKLVGRLSKYFDPKVSHEEMRRIAPGAMESTQRFKAAEVRDTLRRKRGFLPEKMVRYCYRPFDLRWLYWEPETKLLDEKRSDYFPHVFKDNLWLSAGQRNRKEDFYQPQFTTLLADHHIVESNVAMFPAYLEKALASSLFTYKTQQNHVPNISDDANNYLKAIKVKDSKPLFFHSLAILHAPVYRDENAGAVRQDWPRVPLPTSKSCLEKSSHLGELLAGLLDPETGVPGVTTGTIIVARRDLLFGYLQASAYWS